MPPAGLHHGILHAMRTSPVTPRPFEERCSPTRRDTGPGQGGRPPPHASVVNAWLWLILCMSSQAGCGRGGSGTPDVTEGADSPSELPAAPDYSSRPYTGLVSASDSALNIESTNLSASRMLTTADISGDLVPDLVVSGGLDMGGSDFLPAALVFSGVHRKFDLATALPSAVVVPFTPSGDLFGMTIFAAPGDVDGDGHQDLFISAAESDASKTDLHGLPEGGSAFLLSGPVTGELTVGLDYSAYIFTDSGLAIYLGTSFAALGDLNEDGVDDFAVGSGFTTYVYAQEPQASRAWVIQGPLSEEHAVESIARAEVDVATNGITTVGARVASAGDQDGDGVHDLLVGSPRFPLQTPSGITVGAVFMFLSPISGSLTWEDADAVVSETGSTKEWANLGLSLDGNLDANGDGQSDLLVGAWDYTDAMCSECDGAAFVQLGPLRGHVSLLDNAAMLVGTEDGGLAGTLVAPIGDIDGDEKDDMLVSGPGESGSGYSGSGTVWLLYGGIQGRHDGWHEGDWDVAEITGGGGSGHFGGTMSGGQDMDGDGWPDFAIADPLYYGGTISTFWGGPI